MVTPDYASLYADAAELHNHWWWRPGWRVGTRFYTWHLTLDDQEDVHRLIDDYQAALADNVHLDPVPRRWRHITMTGIGDLIDVSQPALEAAIDNVRSRVAGLGPITAHFHHVSIFAEAIALGPDNPDVFAALQNATQAATAEVVSGADGPNPRFRAHVSMHYCNSDQPVKPVRQALDAVSTAPATATFRTIDLICLNRDNRMYQWEPVQRIALD